MIIIMSGSGKQLKEVTTCGILDLEFAYTAEKSGAVVNAWSNAGVMPAAFLNTWLDFIFLFFYSLLLFTFCKRLNVITNNSFNSAGSYLARGAIAAGFLDILENTGMLLTLNHLNNDAISLLTAIFSIIKWILVLAAILYLVVAAGIFLIKKVIQSGEVP